jgi:HEAT repeat protein
VSTTPAAPAPAASTPPATPQQTPAITGNPAVQAAAPAIPASAPPAVPAPAPTSAPSIAPQVPPPPPAVPVPVKRADGKHELLLKNGTVFIGTIVSENDRFLSFGTSEGTTINILKRLIRKLDGVPYVIQTAAASPLDTSSQLKRIAPAGPAPEKTAAAAPPQQAKPAVIKRRQLPNIAIKPGVSMAELIDSLKSTFPDQRAVSARQIGTMGQWATGSIGALAALLADTAGSRELPPLDSDSASMEKMLPPGFEAARALIRIGPKGIDELRRGTQSGNPLVRQRSVFGCSESQETNLLAVFQAALKDDDPRVRAMAVRGLRFNDAKDALVNTLDDRDGDVRTVAASALGELRSPGAVKSLIVALKDVRPSVRTQAALSLAKIGAKEAIAPISALASDMESPVRENAVTALGMLKDTASTAPLLLAMADPNPNVRTAAVKSLAALYDPRAIPSLYTAMQEKNDTVRAAVESAIKQLTEIPLLISALDNENSLVRGNVAYILWLMTGKDLGQDKKAWTEWYAEQGKAPKKTAPAKAEVKKEEKKAEEKTKN